MSEGTVMATFTIVFREALEAGLIVGIIRYTSGPRADHSDRRMRHRKHFPVPRHPDRYYLGQATIRPAFLVHSSASPFQFATLRVRTTY